MWRRFVVCLDCVVGENYFRGFFLLMSMTDRRWFSHGSVVGLSFICGVVLLPCVGRFSYGVFSVFIVVLTF